MQRDDDQTTRDRRGDCARAVLERAAEGDWRGQYGKGKGPADVGEVGFARRGCFEHLDGDLAREISGGAYEGERSEGD
ncbi:hypothetical protein E2562_030373 [Oryza meyeriana var. granulata]|uniref:Uncharacterized protein n=1 Tax=Oryza meyeriana var. granulata TaxID=110450 RepID=A0A6G1DPM4_9ORYZ|nr:hypothetical protein E2562_030373 [Oryza meyeriana var. granulata]